MSAAKAKQPNQEPAQKTGRISSIGSLLGRSGTQFRHHWLLLSLVTLAVALPLNLIQADPNLGVDPTVTAYLTVAAMVMNLAAISVCLAFLAGRSTSFKSAYFQGTANIVAFLLTSAVVALCLLPALLGLLVYALGVSQSGVAVSTGEQILIGLIGLLVALPSFWLVTRLGWAIYAAAEGSGPLASLSLSWRLTRRRFWAVLGRGLALVGLFLLVLMVPLTIINIVTSGNLWVAGAAQALATIILLSFANLYLGQIYRELRGA